MDDYPERLKPLGEGFDKEPFDEWWPRVSGRMPEVPEEVARQLVYDHWGLSPFGWLPSTGYDYQRIQILAHELSGIPSDWSDYSTDQRQAIAHGQDVLQIADNRLASFIVQHRAFPVPPILAENSDGHLNACHGPYPLTRVLIEGRTRLCIALALADGLLAGASLDFWLMRRRP